MAEHIISLTEAQELAVTRTVVINTPEGVDVIINSAYLQNTVESLVNSWVDMLKKKDIENLTGLAEQLINLPQLVQTECVAFLQQKVAENQTK